MLHFGDIDIGTSSEQLSMFLENLGQKTAQFTIDLGRNDLELIVDPMRGIIQVSMRILHFHVCFVVLHKLYLNRMYILNLNLSTIMTYCVYQ